MRTDRTSDGGLPGEAGAGRLPPLSRIKPDPLHRHCFLYDPQHGPDSCRQSTRLLQDSPHRGMIVINPVADTAA